MKISGIYKIVNTINGRFYIGSSDDIKRRWSQHRALLRNSHHENEYLQNAWNKHGENAFEFIIIKRVPVDNLLRLEQKYLEKCNRDVSYNLTFNSTSPMKGVFHSAQTKRKISRANKGRKMSLKNRKNLSLKMKGKYSGRKNPMYGTNRSGKNNPMFGKNHTQKTKNKISLSLKKSYENRSN